jgi:aryl-alcohol dehydrogenase-like predicted oxidoreductase
MNEKIELRSLGKTGIQVSPVGMGVMEFSGSKNGVFRFAFPFIPREDKNAIIQAAIAGGINWFDTAEMYGLGESERALASALKAAGKGDDEVVVATKWLPYLRTAENIPKTIDNRLQNLDGYSIDLYMIHQPHSFSPPEAEMDAMADLVEAGKIRSVGVSNFNVERMSRAHAALAKRGLPLAANQMHYSLMAREIETNGVLDVAKELGITITADTPLESGLLTGKFHQNPELLDKKPSMWRRRMQRKFEDSKPLIAAMEKIAVKYDATIAQVALNWVINFQGETVVTIPGATKVYQVEQNAGAMKFKLSADELAQLDELSRAFR